MVKWQVTATTVHCESIDDEVTIMVFRDGKTKCTGYEKYHESARGKKKPGCKLGCNGPDCPSAIKYRDRLFAEEKE